MATSVVLAYMIFTTVVAAMLLALRGGRRLRLISAAASSAEPNVDIFLRLTEHHKRACDFLSKAITYDEENGDLRELAMFLYRKASEQLQKGIALDQSQGQETMVNIEHLGDELPWHAGVARRQPKPKRRQWQKVAPRKDAASSRDGPSWLKRALQASQFREGRRPPPPPPLGTCLPGGGSFRGEEGRRVSALKGIDSRLAHIILHEIVVGGLEVLFSDIACQEVAKQALGERVILPTDRPKSRVLRLVHTVHPGLEKTKMIAWFGVWWPGLDIARMVQSCQICQEH
nr:spastin-like [Dermacentor andersoni]